MIIDLINNFLLQVTLYLEMTHYLEITLFSTNQLATKNNSFRNVYYKFMSRNDFLSINYFPTKLFSRNFRIEINCLENICRGNFCLKIICQEIVD